jgi:hypothetical protein
MVTNLNTVVIYCSIVVIYHCLLTLGNVGTEVNKHDIFITLAPGANWDKIQTLNLRISSRVLDHCAAAGGLSITNFEPFFWLFSKSHFC